MNFPSSQTFLKHRETALNTINLFLVIGLIVYWHMTWKNQLKSVLSIKRPFSNRILFPLLLHKMIFLEGGVQRKASMGCDLIGGNRGQIKVPMAIVTLHYLRRNSAFSMREIRTKLFGSSKGPSKCLAVGCGL